MGVSHEQQIQPEETEAILLERMQEMQVELRLLSPYDRDCLDLAMRKCPALASDRSFQVSFLRTEVLDAKRAAKRYATYWKHRVNLFGPVRAFLPLVIKDEADVMEATEQAPNSALTTEDMHVLKYGFTRVVAGHGRVLLIDPSRTGPKSDYKVDSIVRCLFYTATKALLADEEMQRKGGIFILDMKGSIRGFDRALIKRLTETTNDGFPLRCSACCILRPPLLVDTFVKIAKVFLRSRVRNRIHVVTSESKLEKHVGVYSMEALFEAADHKAWLNQMRTEDSKQYR